MGNNIREGGINGRLSKETKIKIGNGVRGEKNGNWKRQFNNQHRQKISESKQGEKNPMYGNKGLLNSCFNKPLSDEHKKN